MPPNGPNQQATGKGRPGNASDDLDLAEDIEANGVSVAGGDNALRGLLGKEWESSQAALRYFSLDWDEFEDLLFVQGRTPDQSRVRVSEGSLSTIVIERAGRVMSQLPSGSVYALGLQNQGKGLLMELLLDKYIFPNANEQYDFETKLFLWDLYSNVYGAMAMVYDWCVRPNYTGPDCWLVPIRNFFPQQGRLSIQNCDYVFISTFMSRDALMEIYEEGDGTYYDLEAIRQILEKTAHGATMPKARQDYLRTNPMWEWRRRAPFTDTGEIEIVTKYESGEEGRWIDFAPDFGNIVIRNIKNPHKDGRIPVVLKYGLPTLDSIIGRGDMEAGRYQQYALDTTLNLQIDAQKIRTYPPIKIINGNVVMPTVRFQPGAKWLVSNPNDISHHQFPDVDNNQNLTYQFLKGALNNTLGNTTVQVSTEASAAPSQGKTPKAISAMQQSQSTRDNIDMKFMGKAIQELIGGMLNLIVSVDHDEPMSFYMFGKEIQQLVNNYDDVKDAIRFDGKTKGQKLTAEPGQVAKIVIKPSRLKAEKGYLYMVEPGSTGIADPEKEHENLLQVLDEYLPNAGSVEALLNKSGQTMDFAELWKDVLATGGLRNYKKYIKALALGSEPGQMGSSNQGNGQAGAKPPAMTVNYRDVAGTPAGDAMLQQDNLPPVGAAGAQAARPPSVTGPSGPVPAGQPAMAEPMMPQDPEIAHAMSIVNARSGIMNDQVSTAKKVTPKGAKQ